MGKELGFIGGYIDAHGTFSFASLTGEAEIERLFHFLAAPAVTDHPILSTLALRHLPEQMGAAAGGVLFFSGGAVAGAHHSAFVVPALAYAYAAQSSLG
jgi:hypothetical protein